GVRGVILLLVGPLIGLVMVKLDFRNGVREVYVWMEYGNGEKLGMGMRGVLILRILLMVIGVVKKVWKEKTEEGDVSDEG
ncbi:hypothetical protein, partial [Bacillus altitudinis]|uniref:hypothetical protein n=1 Tax=Bacillus altitudinis TaxID=293387 RepID=UPI001C92BAB1